MTKSHKAARQYNDQYICSHCGKQWDVNDPDPPDCVESLVTVTSRPATLTPQDKVTTQDRVNNLRKLLYINK